MHCPCPAGADTIDLSWIGCGWEETLLGLELVVTLGVAVLICGLAARRFRIAPPVLLLACGALLGFVTALRRVHLPPEVVLLLFLPALLYWESLAQDEPALRYDQQYTALRLAVLARKRATVLRLRDERRIDDIVLRQIQARLDIEEVRLARRETVD